jgi:hypothetical protein
MSQTFKFILSATIVIAILLVAWAIETLRDFKPALFSRLCLWAVGIGIVALVLLLALRLSHARDLGQWDAQDPALKEWYQSLMRPDAPTSSCCGEADAYWADEFHVRDGKTYATITDDRPDAPRGRPHVENGTEFEVPPEKLKWDRSNPTGHGVLFLSRQGYVFCYVQPGGA